MLVTLSQMVVESGYFYRNFDAPEDIVPESLTFVSATDSPSGKALLITANEESNTTAIFELYCPHAATARQAMTICIVTVAQTACLAMLATLRRMVVLKRRNSTAVRVAIAYSPTAAMTP